VPRLIILPASYIEEIRRGWRSETAHDGHFDEGTGYPARAIRDLRHWPAGTRLVVESTPEVVLLKPAPLFPASSIDQVFGSLEHKGAALSIEDMEAAIAKEARRRARDCQASQSRSPQG